MIPALLVLELALRGAAAGILAAMAIAFLREGPSRSTRASGVLFCLAASSYALISSPILGEAIGVLRPAAIVAALGGIGYCWLFVVTLFEDRPVSWKALTPAATLTAIGLAGVFMPPSTAGLALILHNLLGIALSLHALLIIKRSWLGDLVEPRRRIRGPLMAVVAGYAIAVSGVEIGQRLGVEAGWYGAAGAVALVILSLLGGATFLTTRTSVFGMTDPERVPRPVTEEPDVADRLTLDLLEEAMRKREVWRQENLSIGTLAKEVQVPEHVLRRLINGHLGYRNFAAYLNSWRIAAAMEAFADPSRARMSIAAVAFELGFGSLGPFNRAFREATGRTPTQWRAEALEKGRLNPKNPG